MNKGIYLLTILSIQLTFSQGLKFVEQDQLEEFEQLDTEVLGFGSDTPSSYSLERYVPEVVSQTGGTCVGYSSLYYGLSTMYNQRFNITSPRGKLAHAFDPNFIYSIIKNQVDNCEEGLHMYEAFELLEKIGAKKLFFSPYINCSSTWDRSGLSATANYTSPYKIDGFNYFKMDHPKLINNMKQMIALDYPLIAGFSFVNSMYPYSSSNPNGVDSSGLWTPRDYELEEGGHAMCIVGYDDYKYGGSFRVVNSWGSEYGDKGYLWVKYSDIKKYVSQIYLMRLNENIDDSSWTKQISSNDYVRLRLQKNNYEGQYKYQKFNGIGILSFKNMDAYVIGQFSNSKMNGNLYIIDNDGIFSAYAENGEILEVESLGFASQEEMDDNREELLEHLKITGLNYGIRKANSTKISTLELDYEN